MNWIIALLLLGGAAASQADVFVTGTGHYRMSDRDSDAEAQQIAFQRALTKAREQAGPLHVSSQTHWVVTEWGAAARHEQFDQETAIRSAAQLRLISKVVAPVEEVVRTAVRLGDHTIYLEDRVRYWTCAVRVQVLESGAGAAQSDVPAELASGRPTGPADASPKPVPRTGPSSWPTQIQVPERSATDLEAAPTAPPPPSVRTATASSPEAETPARVRHASASSPQEQLFSAGLEHLLRGNWHLARDLFSRVLRRNPTHGDALYLLAFCLEKSGDHQAFRQVLSRAVRSHPHKSIYGVLEARLDGAARPTLAL